MREFANIERRIERLCTHVSCERIDAWWLAEMGDVLAVGYAQALSADARSRKLAERINRLLEDLDQRHAAHQAQRLAKERRAVEDAAQRLRTRLDVVRTLFARAGARSDSV
jgi:signal transduction histidine kinase